MTPHTLLWISKKSTSGQPTLAHKGTLGLPCEGKQPQIFAKADASEAFTFRAMVSSTGSNASKALCHPIGFFEEIRTDYIPKDIETRHDADEQHLRTHANEPFQQNRFHKEAHEVSQYFASLEEPKKNNQTRHPQQENPSPSERHHHHLRRQLC
jgi:hypothetical protein